MKYSYYPGCTLRTKAKDLDVYARASAAALGIELEEIEDWQCCGGVYPLGSDEIATKLSSVRALNAAKEKGQELVTMCSACHHVIKRVNDDMKNVEDIRTRANNYMELEEPYAGETVVLHFLEVLRDRVGFDELKKKVTNPLKGKKIGAYYGCLLLRPSKLLSFDDPENPKIIEDFIRAIGAEPVIYPYRNECCGGYISLKEKEMAEKKVTDKKLKITLVKSTIGQVPKSRATIEAMGLRKLNQTVELPDNASTRGQIQRVRHMVKVEEV